MHIKTIYLDGFKSYAKRTEIKGFDKEFNAITGLNGTGKSNILDSICFVLGISSLNQVRVNSLQDLIYKSGQAGITKATVSLVLDNTNKDQSPTGYEQYNELIISRQVEMGGKNKYLINGVTVQNKKVHELFCSVQLNVNNPHFLIMQGRVTKVLNMKPMEILAMIEEAAGIRMYEAKREVCIKLLKKKEEKISEFNSLIDEELQPQLEKLRKDRNLLIDLNAAKQSVHKLESLHKCFILHSSKKALDDVEIKLTKVNSDIDGIRAKIESNKNKIVELDKEIEQSSDKDAERVLEKFNAELKLQENEQSKEAAAVKGAKQNIESEKKRLCELQKNLDDDTKVLKSKEVDLSKLKSLYNELQSNDNSDKAAYKNCQKQYEALIAGMEINEEGQAETLLEQLTNARGCVSNAITSIKQAELQLQHRKTQLKEKEPLLASYKDDYYTKKRICDNLNQELQQIQEEMKKINYSETEVEELKDNRNILNRDARALKEYVHNFTSRIPQAQFAYVDPEPNFNRSKVLGVVYTLFEADPRNYLALETAAGSRLLNVVVDTSETSKKLLEKGRLQVRTTIIPLNGIQAHPIPAKTVDYAKNLVGAENVDSAISLVKYDKNIFKAMAYVFGDVLICKDITCAKTLAFDPNIRRKCVTLAGDVVDPSGVLSGGAIAKDGSLLSRLKDFQIKNFDFQAKSQQINDIEINIQKLAHNSGTWNEFKKKIDIKQHDLQLQKRQLEMTKYYELQEEIKNLQQNIVELNEQLKMSRELENKNQQKIKELEEKLKDSDGYKKKELKRVESELAKLKVKAAKSESNLKKHAEDFEVIDLEIKELETGIENIKQQILTCEQNIADLQKAYNEQNNILEGKCEKLKKILKEIENEKLKLKQKNAIIKEKQNNKDQLLAEISERELEIKKKSHNQKKLEEEFNKVKAREKEYSKNAEKMDPAVMKEAENLSDEEGRKIHARLKSLEEKIKNLKRIVNPHAQNMLDSEEKKHTMMLKSKGEVESEKKQLVDVIKDLDNKKLILLKDAVAQIGKDFGSIFSTLLPGANCKLQPMFGKPITQGIDIKVALGNIWKESLTELSGGQRSLVALSLILSMLMFKPAPFYILDEIDAALDMSHTQNIGLMIKKHFKKSQFIIVSLKDDMFTNANVLFKTAFIDGASSVLRVVNSFA